MWETWADVNIHTCTLDQAYIDLINSWIFHDHIHPSCLVHWLPVIIGVGILLHHHDSFLLSFERKNFRRNLTIEACREEQTG